MIRLWYHITWYIMPILVASIIVSGELLVTYEPSMNAYAAASKGLNLGSQRASLETHTPTQASPSTTTLPPNSAFCTLTIQNVTPDLRTIAQRYRRAFKVFCPELAKRFALRPDAVGNVILTFSTTVPAGAVAVTSDSHHIMANPQAMETQNGRTVGVIVHETEHVMQFTSPAWFKATPSWFTEGLADYVRSIYGPQGDAWSMPPVQPTDSYKEAYAVAARFLHWLDQRTAPHTVDRLSRAMLLGQSFPTVFHQLTGGTVDQLWQKYEADSALKPFQRIPAPD
jgi:hypothetical protein